jgi:thiol:disulfide interchange protein
MSAMHCAHGPQMHTSRRGFLGIALAASLPLTVLAAEEPASLPLEFEPARDPARDLDLALRIAKAARRRVIVDVGGEWCSWCHILDRFFTANPDLKRYRDANFVWLKVNWSAENHNDAFLRRYPAIKGYPHLFVLDSGGRLLHSQDTEMLETTKNYDPAAVRAFLVKWAPT